MARIGWWSPKLWREWWVALRRSNRDAKARRNLLYLSGYLLFIFGWIGFNLFRAYRHDLFNVGRMIAAVFGFNPPVPGRFVGGLTVGSRTQPARSVTESRWR